MKQVDDSDVWRQGPAAPKEPTEAPLVVREIDGVEPLGNQLGIAKLLTVPVVLRDALFGQSDLSEGFAVRPLQTYAILDAAKVMGLVEMLDSSGLEYACLFTGETAGELQDVAPYIVRLEEANTFTRNLFTKGDAGWQMWDREPGIHFRSRASLHEMRQHLRKFTKVRDKDGTWYYFRFWDRDAQEAMVHAARNEVPEMKKLFITSGIHQPVCVYLPSFGAIITTECMGSTDAAGATITPNDFLATLLQIIKQNRMYRDLSAIARKIDLDADDSVLVRALGALFDAGFTNKAQLLQLGQIEFASKFKFLEQPQVSAVIHSHEPRYAAFVRLVDMAGMQGVGHGAR